MAELRPAAQQKKEIIEQLRDPLVIETIRRVLPNKMTPERFIIIVQTEMRRIPELAGCSNAIAAFLQAAQLGLEPGVLGECWIIPFKGEAVFIPGYRGLAQLAWRSGLVKALQTRAVFDGDDFDWEYGTSARIRHRPRGETDPKKILYAYSIVDTVLGGTIFDVMERDEIERTRARSRAANKGPWVTDYTEMAKKTPFRRLMKIAPTSVEMRTAFRLDDAADTGETQSFDVPLPAMLLDPKNRVEPAPIGRPDLAAAKGPIESDDASSLQKIKGSIEKQTKDALLARIRTQLDRIEDPEKRAMAMDLAVGTKDWPIAESFSIAELSEAIAGGRVVKIVDEILGEKTGETQEPLPLEQKK